jgi:hypothetical protein
LRRRTLFKGAAAAGVAAVGGAFTAAQPAAAASYNVMTCEQSSNRIMSFSDATGSWTDSNLQWSWSAPSGDSWNNLSDVKRRSTANWNDIILVTASGTASGGGRAAMVDLVTGPDQIVWQCNVPGNPHSIERIVNHGAIVVASSRKREFASSFSDGGGLSIFVPSTHGGKPSTSYSSSISVGFEGAHGVLWDTTHDLLLAVGKNELRAYSLVTDGDDMITGLRYEAGLGFSGTGHDLQPDYSSGKLFFTVGGTGDDHGVWEATLSYNTYIHTWQFAADKIHDWYHTKAYSRLPDGTSFWVDAPSDTVWWNDNVGFADRADGYRSGAMFYKARYDTTSFL